MWQQMLKEGFANEDRRKWTINYLSSCKQGVLSAYFDGLQKI
jgi:hypothetical protein